MLLTTFFVIPTTLFIKPDAAVGAAFEKKEGYKITLINRTKGTQVYIRSDLGDINENNRYPENLKRVSPGKSEIIELSSIEGKGPHLISFNKGKFRFGPTFKIWEVEHRNETNISFEMQGEYSMMGKDTHEMSEVVGDRYRVTVDGGGNDNPDTNQIFIQVYDFDRTR